jgi:hypothetical protein
LIIVSAQVTEILQEEYADRLISWGRGVDTQGVLPFDTPDAFLLYRDAVTFLHPARRLDQVMPIRLAVVNQVGRGGLQRCRDELPTLWGARILSVSGEPHPNPLRGRQRVAGSSPVSRSSRNEAEVGLRPDLFLLPGHPESKTRRAPGGTRPALLRDALIAICKQDSRS